MNGTHQQANRVNILVWVFAVIKLCASKHCPSLPTVKQKRENTTDTPSVWKSILMQGRLDAHIHLLDSIIHSFLNLLLVWSQRRNWRWKHWKYKGFAFTNLIDLWGLSVLHCCWRHTGTCCIKCFTRGVTCWWRVRHLVAYIIWMRSESCTNTVNDDEDDGECLSAHEFGMMNT